MDVDDPSECGPLLVAGEKFSSEDCGTAGASNTYVAARKSAIIFKISVSLFEVSSNPGVSMSHYSSIESELICKLDLSRTRFQLCSNS